MAARGKSRWATSKLGKQGVHAAQKPEKHGPLGKTITGRRKPHAALRGLHKGHDARCLAGTVDAVSHEGRPCLCQHDEQQGYRPAATCSIKNFVAKAGADGLDIRWGSRLSSGLERSGQRAWQKKRLCQTCQYCQTPP